MMRKSTTKKKRLRLLFVLSLYLSFLINHLLCENLDTFLYGQEIESIVFTDINDRQEELPTKEMPTICFFIPNSERDIRLLNDLFFIIAQLKRDKKIFIFIPGSKAHTAIMELKKNTGSLIIPQDKNKNEKQSTFIGKGCSVCFSMLILEDRKVKFFRQGNDYYLYKEVLQTLAKEK